MPAKNLHLLQATKNEQFFEDFDLDRTPYLDWATVALFYSALHLVDAYLAGQAASVGMQPSRFGGHHPNTHAERYRKVTGDPRLLPVAKEYRELRQRSDDVRYRLLRVNPQFVRNLARNEFATVKSHITSLL